MSLRERGVGHSEEKRHGNDGVQNDARLLNDAQYIGPVASR